MLHTKFQGHRSSGSGEEDFLRFLPYMGMAAMLVMWPIPFEQLFFPNGPGGCIWNLVAIGPVVSEEKSFEIVDGRRTTDDGRTDRRTTDDGAFPSYKLPRSLRLRWAKKKISQNYPKSASIGFFLGTQERIGNSRSKRVIRVWATEVLLLFTFSQFYLSKHTTLSIFKASTFGKHKTECQLMRRRLLNVIRAQ